MARQGASKMIAPASAAMDRNALPVHAMVAIGGISALSWELLWQLKTTLAFGVPGAGTALTLAVTMGVE